MDRVACQGAEATRAECPHQGWGQHHCARTEDAAVRGRAATLLILRGGNSPYKGRVEVYHDGRWGTVCDDGWDLNDANVVCRQLGYREAWRAAREATYGQGGGPIWMDDLRCRGDEESLGDCPFSGWGVHNCAHAEDASVVCR